MAVAAFVQKYFPSKRDLKSQNKELRAITVLTSFASDFDLIGDWAFYWANRNIDLPPVWKNIQFGFCLIGLITWLMLATDGRIVRPILKYFKISSFTTGHLLFFGVILEDVPQMFLSFKLDQFGGSQISNFALVNIMTAGYDILIKLAEAYDERGDVHNTGASILSTYLGHRGWIRSLAMIDEDYFISGSGDNTAKLWYVKIWELSLKVFSFVSSHPYMSLNSL